MSDNTPYPEHLRAEYDTELEDVDLRKKNADRHYRALNLAGLWRDGFRILDVGAGTGYLLSAIGNEAVKLRIASDLRRTILVRGRELANSVRFVQSDGSALPFPGGQFDLVMCLAVIGEFPDWQTALIEMGRCVAPHGILYVTVANSQFLLWFYSLAEKFGFRIRKSWWTYAGACRKINDWNPEKGMGALSMAEWRFIDLTPYLVQAQWRWTRLLPIPLWAWFLRFIAPSHGFAWQKLKTP